MFDTYARQLIDQLPRLPDLDPVACRRVLTRAYMMLVDGRLGGEASPSDSSEAVNRDLRRMANALESVAVFDPLNGVDVLDATRQASAFVAAEALSLLTNQPLAVQGAQQASPADRDLLQDARLYAQLESGLLYMIGGYDINAVAVVSGFGEVVDPAGEGALVLRLRCSARLVRRIIAFCGGVTGPIPDQRLQLQRDVPPLLGDLLDDTRARLFERLAEALDIYLDWLAGREGKHADTARNQIEAVRNACWTSTVKVADMELSGFSDVYHLASLLAAALDATRARSVVHCVPPPNEGDPGLCAAFPVYVRKRAQAVGGRRGRPLLWPSTLEYVNECLPGPYRDAVISMPTGSGKSFLAELAVAHALPRGWVLYLAPTNALAHQIRRDLAGSLKAFSDVRVAAFVGGAEYSAFTDEVISDNKFVAVMTPEKCALALRLYPEVFSHCSLCVFDECHLLNDPNRGATADILLAQLFHAAPNMRTLLMSAMVANGDDLASWLHSVRGGDAFPSSVKWRPSRAARAFVFLEKTAYETSNENLRREIVKGKAGRTLSQEVPLGWLAGLSGPWMVDGGPADFRASRLPMSAMLEVKRSRKNEVTSQITSWKNRTGQTVAELFASCQIPTINFVLSSRHHAFSNAANVSRQIPDAIGAGPFPSLEEARLAVADAELGVETCLRELFRKGIAVHTSAMLQVEQAASESMFAKPSGGAKLMFATGTLAQGLNLPAIAVVVSGSKLADMHALRDADAAAGITRANELILNGFGRAGRPGFANQGLVVLISDDPYLAPIVSELDGRTVVDKFPVLGHPDASVTIRSPIEDFLDELLVGEIELGATKLDVALTSLLAAFEGDEENAGTILRRTFAGHQKGNVFTVESARLASERVAYIKASFLEREGVPSWMPQVAMKAGVDFFRAQRMWEAYNARGLVDLVAQSSLDVRGWFNVFIDVLSHMPVGRMRDYLDEKKTETPLTRLHVIGERMGFNDTVPWERPNDWLTAWSDLAQVVMLYMNGNPYIKIGEALFGKPAANFTSSRTNATAGLPAVFKFIGATIERSLAMDAGCFLALHEGMINAENRGTVLPEALQALPLCVRNGCDDLDSLAWFRFGFRQRVCAHALADAFPCPVGISGEEERRSHVRETKKLWLDGAVGGGALLEYARTIVREGSSERA